MIKKTLTPLESKIDEALNKGYALGVLTAQRIYVPEIRSLEIQLFELRLERAKNGH